MVYAVCHLVDRERLRRKRVRGIRPPEQGEHLSDIDQYAGPYLWVVRIVHRLVKQQRMTGRTSPPVHTTQTGTHARNVPSGRLLAICSSRAVPISRNSSGPQLAVMMRALLSRG
jgi:hypothetical protein